jgi:prolyl oligopeptidase
MSKLSHACQALGLAAGLAGATAAHAQAPAGDDPYAWLEDVGGDRALGWVREQNAKAEAELASTPEFKRLEAEILAILDSDEKIPGVEKIGDYYYNFWKDKNHQRGLWRRTTLEEYRKPRPQWETVIDLDALNKAEGENWVWHGADCLKPEYRRCLVALSRGGADADVTREFDLSTKTWVEGGFFRSEAKGALGWIDADNVYVYTDFGAGSMTSSGYPRIVKQWKRGTRAKPTTCTSRRCAMWRTRTANPSSSAISSAAPSRSTTTSCTCWMEAGAEPTASSPRSTCPTRSTSPCIANG